MDKISSQVLKILEWQRTHDKRVEYDGHGGTDVLKHIQDKIYRHFTLDELREVVFELGDAVDALNEEGNRKQKTIYFVEWFDRRHRINDLLNVCRILRPRTKWPQDIL